MAYYNRNINRSIKDEEEYTNSSKSYSSSNYHYWKDDKQSELCYEPSVFVSYSHPVLASERILIGKINDSLEEQFTKLAAKWKSETGVFSTTYQKVMNDAYLDIIGMGKDVVPLILKDLVKGGSVHWHTALKAITKANPVSGNDLTKAKKVREAWIDWGKKNKLI